MPMVLTVVAASVILAAVDMLTLSGDVVLWEGCM